MNEFFAVLRDELAASLPTPQLLARVFLRLTAAWFFAALIGWQRERHHKSAGLRTHILVSLGAALFALTAQETGAAAGDMTRVAQGVATGIGFLGAGVILQLADERRVQGLTTAAGIWLTAAIGLAAGMGALVSAAMGTLCCVTVLGALQRFEHHGEPPARQTENGP